MNVILIDSNEILTNSILMKCREKKDIKTPSTKKNL